MLSFNVYSHTGALPKEVQERFSSDTLRHNFYNSRKALEISLLKAFPGIAKWEDWNNLEFDNFLHLKNYPTILHGLSHTKNLGAAVAVSSEQYESVGIDIEWKTRKIKEGILKFFRNEKDHQDIDNLSLWCAKEAAFKAVYPLEKLWSSLHEVLVLNHLFINKEKEFGLVKNEKVLGKIEILFDSIQENDYLLALASIEKSS